jgi:hypothetical protein
MSKTVSRKRLLHVENEAMTIAVPAALKASGAVPEPLRPKGASI